MVDEEMESQQTQASESTVFTTQSIQTVSSRASYTCEIWGKLWYQKLRKRSLGIRRMCTYESDGDPKEFEVTGPAFFVGRLERLNQLSCTSFGIDENAHGEFSSRHFKLSKDLNDVHSPVILDDLSTNGTFVRVGEVEDKVEKKRIIVHGNVIVVKAIPAEFKFENLKFPPKDLPVEITQQYHIGKRLGAGAFGVIYSVHDVLSFKQYALKFVKKSSLPDPQQIKRVYNEAELLKSLKHPFIIQIHGEPLRFEDGSIGMLLDMMVGGDLQRRIHRSRYLREENAKFFFYQMCLGVKYLHDQRVTHRDIKPENILLASTELKSRIKITDFGLSKQIHDGTELRTYCGTGPFLAPEIKHSHVIAYTNKTDVWSLGISLFGALCGEYPDENDDRKIFVPHPNNIVTSNAKRLIKKILTIDEKHRPSIRDLLNDVWMQDQKIIDDVNTLLQMPMTTHIRSESPMTVDISPQY